MADKALGFWKIMLSVTPDVLSPRPDTEAILDVVMLAFPPHKAFEMIDLGTGSGAILLATLAERFGARGVGTDISSEALAKVELLNQQIAANKAASPASSTPTKDLSLIATRPWLVYAELEGLRFFLHSLSEGKIVGCN